MKKAKNIFLTGLLLVFLVSAALAQQAPIFTQYSYSYAYSNPGFIGMSEGINILGLYRQQWAGFTDEEGNKVAPMTILVSADSPIKVLHGGIGLSVVQDNIGFEKNTNVNLGYAFHIDLGNSTLSIGVSGGLLNRKTDFSKYKPINESDPLISGLGEESRMMFDMSAGIFWQMPESVYVGISATNLLQSTSRALSETNENSASFITDRTFYLMAGYPFQFNALPNFRFEPSVGLLTNISAFQFNASFKATYKNVFSLGVNYRHKESVGFMVGITIKDFVIGYAYDLNIMGLGVPGSHEVALNYCFKLNFDKTPKDYRSVRYL